MDPTILCTIEPLCDKETDKTPGSVSKMIERVGRSSWGPTGLCIVLPV